MLWGGPHSTWVNSWSYSGSALLHTVFWFMIVLAGLAVLDWALRVPARRRHRHHRRPSAVEALERRYASGEVSRHEYLQRKRDLAA